MAARMLPAMCSAGTAPTRNTMLGARRYLELHGAPPTAKERSGTVRLAAYGLILTVFGAGAMSYFAKDSSNDVAQKANQAFNKAKEEGEKALHKAGAGAGATVSALSKDEWRKFKVQAVEPYNHNTKRFIFSLPEGTDSGLTVASALLTQAAAEGACVDDKGKPVIRPYTPVTAPNEKGRLDLLIKVYDQGKMSQHMNNLKPGDELKLKGPIPKFQYKPNEFQEIALVAGGSGITPMWQIMQHIAANPADKTKVTLLFSNVAERDILLREEFDRLAKSRPDQFKVNYFIDQKAKGWKGEVGYIDEERLKKYLPMPGMADKIKVFVCGPPPQVEILCGQKKSPSDQGELKGVLADMGYQISQVYKF